MPLRIKTKTKKQAFTITLSPAALALLASMPRIVVGTDADGNPIHSKYVFTRYGRSPCSGFSKANDELDKLAPLPEWRLHDLRRTFASGLAALGVPVFICDKCLNHVPEDLKGVAKIYQKHKFSDPMAEAWKLWGVHVASIVKGRRDH